MNLAAGNERYFLPYSVWSTFPPTYAKRTERDQRVGFNLACFQVHSLAQYPGLSKASISLPCLRMTINKNFILKAPQFGQQFKWQLSVDIHF